MLPSLVAGSLTPLALWWLARRWFTPAVAIGAATLAACSDFHVLYSRAALTDCLLGLLLVVAVGWIEKAVSQGRGTRNSDGRSADRRGLVDQVQRLVAAGDRRSRYRACSACRTTRVRGSTLVMAARGAPSRRSRCWPGCPCSFRSQPFGGYQAVAANHARYVAGLAGWPASAARQHANLQYLDGMVTVAGLAVAFGIGCRHACVSSERPVTARGRDGCGGQRSAGRLVRIAPGAVGAGRFRLVEQGLGGTATENGAAAIRALLLDRLVCGAPGCHTAVSSVSPLSAALAVFGLAGVGTWHGSSAGTC